MVPIVCGPEIITDRFNNLSTFVISSNSHLALHKSCNRYTNLCGISTQLGSVLGNDLVDIFYRVANLSIWM